MSEIVSSGGFELFEIYGTPFKLALIAPRILQTLLVALIIQTSLQGRCVVVPGGANRWSSAVIRTQSTTVHNDSAFVQGVSVYDLAKYCKA